MSDPPGAHWCMKKDGYEAQELREKTPDQLRDS